MSLFIIIICLTIQYSILSTHSTTSTTVTRQTTTTTISPEELRLPKTIKPLDYDLHIEPDHDNRTFKGEVTITVVAKENTDVIKLHNEGIDIKLVKVTNKEESKIIPVASNQTFRHFYILNLKEKLKQRSQYLIKIKFRNNITIGSGGYFIGSYTIGNKTSKFSATKFQPIFTRRTFPCFDEPNFKATFKLTITHDKNQIALSNMPVESEKHDGNKTTTKFLRTPVKMSNYLFAWAVGEFKLREARTSRGLKIRIFARPDIINRTTFTLDLAVKIIDYYEEFFDVQFPLPKLDFIFLPDFKTDGMENWGLTSYHEKDLIDPKLTLDFHIKTSSKRISHELAHNWFGNLVTMDWWDDLWLNEGFASYIEYKGVSAAHPNWNILDHIVIDRLQDIMKYEANIRIGKIVQSNINPNFIMNLDTWVYDKGSSVIRMLEDTVGRKAFKSGVRSYLKKHREGNTKASDLWNELNLVRNESDVQICNITEMMSKWTTDSSFPLINVERKDDELILSQKSFNNFQTEAEGLNKNPWIIPIKIINESGIKKSFVLKKTADKMKVDIPENEWFKLNSGRFGYYIVNYTESDWEKLTEALIKNPDVMSPVDRANLIFDAFELAFSEKLNFSVAFNLIMYLPDENSLLPWFTAEDELVKTYQKFESDDEWCMDKLNRYLTKKIYNKIGWDVDHKISFLNQRLLRSTIVHMACDNGNEDCLKEANRRLKQMMNQGQEADVDIRSKVYKFGMRKSNNKRQVIDWMFERYANQPETEFIEKKRLEVLMTSVKDQELLERLVVNVMQNDTQLLKKDKYNFLMQVGLKDPSMIWQLIRNNHTTLDKLLNSDDFFYLIQRIVIRLNDEEKDQAIEFFNQNPKHDYINRRDVLAKSSSTRRDINQTKNNNNRKESTPFADWLEKNTGLGKSCSDWNPDSDVRSNRFFGAWTCCDDKLVDKSRRNQRDGDEVITSKRYSMKELRRT